MSDYTYPASGTTFGSRDGLAPGNPEKVIQGSQFDPEFNAIETAIATKLDSDGGAVVNGTIDSTVIGGTTPAAGTFTTLTATNLDGSLAWSNITGTPTTLVGYGITDAATFAQGALADTATQPGDNVSTLVNDSGYLTTVSFADLTGKPTTLLGYGITDAYTKLESDALTYPFSQITATPTTLVGYGITDAATSAQGALADTAVQPLDDADTLGSGVATDNQVLAADGLGGAAWETLTFSALAGTPTTLAGYGITDAATSAQGALADTAVQPLDNVSTLTNDAGYLINITGESLGDLSNVSAAAPVDADVLAWNAVGATWEPTTLPPGTLPVGTEDQTIRYGVAGVPEATSSLVVDATGNVGIGTTTPSSLLEVSTSDAVNVPKFQVSQGIDGVQPTAVIGNNMRWDGAAWVKQASSLGGAAIQLVSPNSASVYGEIIFNAIDDNNTTAGTAVERMRIDSAGNVGIGTASPEGRLDVSTSDAGITPDGTADNLIVQESGSAGITVGSSTTGRGALFFADSGSPFAGAVFYEHSDDGMRFNTAGAERMRIDSSGNVGIGVTDPASKLEINYSNATTVPVTDGDQGAYLLNTGSGPASLKFNSSGAGVAGQITWGSGAGDDFTFVDRNGSERMRIDSAGNVGIGTNDPVNDLDVSKNQSLVFSSIRASDTGNAYIVFGGQTDTDRGRIRYSVASDFMAFETNNNVEAMRIDSSGNLLVGTTYSLARLAVSGSGTTSATFGLQVRNGAGAVNFYARDDGVIATGLLANSPYNLTTASAANMYVSAGGFLQRSTSSARYKENIRDYEPSAGIDALRPVFFNSKSEGDEKLYAGFIAEEVAQAGLSEFVEFNDSGQPDAVFYQNMVALCVKELQQLRARVATLEAQ